MISAVQWVLAGLALFGFLPLAIILYKRRMVHKILTTGIETKATIFEIRSITFRARHDVVHYSFVTQDSNQPWTGTLTTAIGKYKKGDVLDIYYLADKPQRNTMKGAWASNGILVFGIVIALFILFAVYKLNEMLRNGEM
jgi:hypothetical protein